MRSRCKVSEFCLVSVYGVYGMLIPVINNLTALCLWAPLTPLESAVWTSASDKWNVINLNFWEKLCIIFTLEHGNSIIKNLWGCKFCYYLIISEYFENIIVNEAMTNLIGSVQKIFTLV